jgi:hypothetical protein
VGQIPLVRRRHDRADSLRAILLDTDDRRLIHGKLHRGFDVNRERWIRLQLGSDCIRYQFSEDGSKWTTLRCVERAAELSGAPALLAVGRSYESATHPFDDANDAKSTSGKSTAGVSEVRVEATPKSALTMSDAERAALKDERIDKASLALLAGNADPTFETVAKFYPAFTHPREVVGVPDHPLEIGVNHLGHLDNSPWGAIHRLDRGRRRSELALRGRKRRGSRRRLLDGYIPLVTLKTVREGVRLEQTVFGWSEQMSPDKDTIAFVRIRAIAREGSKPPTKAALVTRGGKRIAANMTATSSDTTEACFSFKHPKPESPSSSRAKEFELKLSNVANFWRKQLSPRRRFDVPSRASPRRIAPGSPTRCSTPTTQGRLPRTPRRQRFYEDPLRHQRRPAQHGDGPVRLTDRATAGLAICSTPSNRTACTRRMPACRTMAR